MFTCLLQRLSCHKNHITTLPKTTLGFWQHPLCNHLKLLFDDPSKDFPHHIQQADDSLFTLFVDLRKAYNSVPRAALWQILERCGVPPRMLRIVKSVHEGMEAEVRVGTSLSDSFEVRNGLWQGCTLAPTLFNIYFSAVVASWRRGDTEAGVDVLFRHGRKLVGDRTAKSRLSVMRVTDFQFADDVALYTTSRGCLETMARKFAEGARRWGLTVSIEKTKRMAVGESLSNEDVAPVQVERGEIEMVDHCVFGLSHVKGWRCYEGREVQDCESFFERSNLQ